VRKRFSAALSHARNALGRECEPIVLTEGRYAINPALRVWFDVREFEQALDMAQRCLTQGAAEPQAIRHLETATQLYGGDLLKDVDAEWVIALRESLRQKCLGVARLQDAVAVLQRAVALDNYSEAAHLALIRAYLQLGERGRARQQYQILLAALNDLGVPPSLETNTLLDNF
jgi:DNA-binding SARP family transcriptional activator